MQKQEYMVFANRLRTFMENAGMTQDTLAERLGVNRASVSYYINGIKMPRMSTIDRICQIFNCRRSDLLDPTGDLSQDESGLISDYRLLIPEERRIARNLVSDMAEKYKKRATGSAS